MLMRLFCDATCAVPDVAFEKFEEKFVPPDVQEGFEEVITWDFAVGPKVSRFTCALLARAGTCSRSCGKIDFLLSGRLSRKARSKSSTGASRPGKSVTSEHGASQCCLLREPMRARANGK